MRPAPATTPKPPTVAGRKNRIGERDAAPIVHATSTPSTVASRSSFPLTGRPRTPRRSAAATSAEKSVAIGCTTAGSWTQSHSSAWIWYAFTTAAAPAGNRLPSTQTVASSPAPQPAAVSTSSRTRGALAPPTPTPSVSRMKVFAASIARGGRSS